MMARNERLILIVFVVVAYAVIAAFLCLAAIQNPDLSDTVQWCWCAAAVAWGPIVAILILWILG